MNPVNFDTFWKAVTSKTVKFWLFRHVLVHAKTGTFRYFEIPRIRS